MASLLDLASDALLGSEEERAERADAGVLGSLHSVAANAGRIFDQSLSMATLFGGVGEGLDVIGGITGTDFLTNEDMAGWERALSLFGVGALGAGAVGATLMHMNGQPVWAMLGRGRPRIPTVEAPVGRGTVGIGPPGGPKAPRSIRMFDVDEVDKSRLIRLNTEQHIRTPERTFMTQSQVINDLLEVEHALTELGEHAAYKKMGGVLAVGNDPRRVQKAVDNIAGFASDLGEQLVKRLPSGQAAQAAGNAGPNLQAQYAAGVLAQWQHAVEGHRARDVTKFNWHGKVAPEVAHQWQNLVSGSDKVDHALLVEGIVKFGELTDWIADPQLYINPYLAVNGLNLDGDPRLTFNVLAFQRVANEDLSYEEFSRRLSDILKLHPAALIGHITDNKRILLDEMVGMLDMSDAEVMDFLPDLRYVPDEVRTGNPAESMKELVRQHRVWYEDARIQLADISQKFVGSDASRHFDTHEHAQVYMVTVASVLSAAEDWQTNVKKANDIVETVAKARKRGLSFDAIHTLVNKGTKVSEDDLARVLLLEGLDDPMDVFTVGKRGKGSINLKEIGRRIVDGGEDPVDLAPLRRLTNHWEGMKQPSFTWAIHFSEADDLEERRHMMAVLMSGGLGHDSRAGLRVGEGLGPTDINRALPVVADRQDFKAGIGFSANPETFFAQNRGAYTQFAQANRILAAEIGEVDGVQVTPEEVQALIWTRLRARTHKSDPLGRDWPRMKMNVTQLDELDVFDDVGRPLDPTTGEVLPQQRNTLTPERQAEVRAVLEPQRAPYEKAVAKWVAYDEKVLDWEMNGRKGRKPRKPRGTRPKPPSVTTIEKVPDRHGLMGTVYGGRSAAGRTAGIGADVSGIAGWVDGRGPEFKFSNSIMELVTGEASIAIPDMLGIAARNDFTSYLAKVDDLDITPSTLDKALKPGLELEMRAGGYQWLVDGVPADTQVRLGMYATIAKEDGRQVLRPVYPQHVDNSGQFFKRITESSVQVQDPNRVGSSGARYRPPGSKPSPMLTLPGPKMRVSAMTDFGEYGGTSRSAHRRLLAEFRKHDIDVQIVDQDAHEGVSHVWRLKNGEQTWTRDVALADWGSDIDAHIESHLEGRRDRWFLFGSTSDMYRARRLLNADVSDVYINRGAVDYMAKYTPSNRVFRTPDAERVTSMTMRRYPDTAKWYRDAPDFDPSPRTLQAYEALRVETRAQFEYLVNELGITVEVVDVNPYTSPELMIRDVLENKHIRVLSTEATGGHGYFTFDEELGIHENDMFRAVHDVFGHAVHENVFDRFGEDVAFYTHAQMFSDDALPALASETRGQNSALIMNKEWIAYDRAMADFEAGKLTEKPTMPKGERPDMARIWSEDEPFEPQKVVAMPERYYRDVRDSRKWGAVGIHDRLIDRIFREEVADISYYVDTDTDAPPGTVPVWEYSYVDDSGGEVINMNVAGSNERHNAVRTWLEPDDLYRYVGESSADIHEPGGPGVTRTLEQGIPREDLSSRPLFHDIGDRTFWDHRIEVVPTTPDEILDLTGKRGQWWDVEVNGDDIHEVWILIPEPGAAPKMAFGPDGQGILGAGGPPERIVRVRQSYTEPKKGKKPSASDWSRRDLIVDLPNMGRRKIDQILFDEVRQLIFSTQSQGSTGLSITPEVLS